MPLTDKKTYRSRLRFQQVLKLLEPTHMVGNGSESAIRNEAELAEDLCPAIRPSIGIEQF
jgi:hypothetical protein